MQKKPSAIGRWLPVLMQTSGAMLGVLLVAVLQHPRCAPASRHKAHFRFNTTSLAHSTMDSALVSGACAMLLMVDQTQQETEKHLDVEQIVVAIKHEVALLVIQEGWDLLPHSAASSGKWLRTLKRAAY